MPPPCLSAPPCKDVGEGPVPNRMLISDILFRKPGREKVEKEERKIIHLDQGHIISVQSLAHPKSQKD
ncbi:hypothetical protein SRHO_G00161110 [Serrasalmus rhombeus]